MSSNGLPEEFEELRIRTRAFIRTVIMAAEPVPGQHLTRAKLVELQAAAKAAGVFAPQVSKEYGGQGVPIQHWSPIFQEIGYSPIGPSVLNCQAPDEGNMHMLSLIGTPAQKETFLRPLANGDVRSCFAMTEPHPGAGSDPDALTTMITRTEGGWLINGEKRFISGAKVAGFSIVMARNDAYEDSPVGATMLLVSMKTPGIRLGYDIHTIDRAIEGGHSHVHFEDCFVADEGVLGEVGKGFRYAQVRLAPARLTHCMRWLGLARRSLDIALDRIERREIFGSKMKDLGLAQELIAQSVIDIETSDAIINKTATMLHVDSKAGAALSSIAKVHCSESIFKVIDRAIQICGGDGVSDELPLASYMSEVRPFRIYDGSNEAHKWAISKRASKHRAADVAAGEPYLANAEHLST